MRVQIATGGEKLDTDDMACTKSKVKAKYKAPMSDALCKLANVLIPLILAFIASGLITGIINILKVRILLAMLLSTIPTCWA